jgi:hypothetical protein
VGWWYGLDQGLVKPPCLCAVSVFSHGRRLLSALQGSEHPLEIKPSYFEHYSDLAMPPLCLSVVLIVVLPGKPLAQLGLQWLGQKWRLET